MVKIEVFKFNKDTPSFVQDCSYKGIDIGNNWPVVYILSNSEEAYIGETVNVARRMEQHWQNEDRRTLTDVRIITDETFNKSSILDLESFLIKYMSADGKYVLQNANNGIQDHQYYDKSKYQDLFNVIWKKLILYGLAEKELIEIENSELFKYSPYKSLGMEQMHSEKEILHALSMYGADAEGVNITVRGGAGTGKTILAIYLIKLIQDINYWLRKDSKENEDILYDYLDKFEESIVSVENLKDIEKVGIVIPQSSLKESIKTVFKSIQGLTPSMVISPAEVVKDYIKTGEKYDLLLVDEAHRLKCRYRGHLSNYSTFDNCNKDLGLDFEQGTELDWILTCSRNQILFRDELQTVRPCDIPGKDFLAIIERYGKHMENASLSTQWRCAGGNDYIDYLKNILSGTQPSFYGFDTYDFRLFENCDEMIQSIREKNSSIGLCRVAAGFAWPWKAKYEKADQVINDIVIQGKEYHWNRTLKNWINTDSSIDEIGCIHTLQGYDLNYAGIIIGEDLKYDPQTNRMYADKDNYYDQQGKSGVANKPEELLEYIKNIYLTLLTRGIKGTYVYVCNNELRSYLKKYIKTQNG